MLKQNFIVLFLITLIFSACEAPLFSDPQPENGRRLDFLPGKIQGTFMCSDSQSLLTINQDKIIRNYNYEIMIAKSELNSTDSISGNELINTHTHQSQKFSAVGDSLKIELHSSDTLFKIGSGNQIRRLGNYYFLNRKVDETHWFVRCIYYNKNILNLSRVLNEEDLPIQEELVLHQDDSSGISLTKKQWIEFEERTGFIHSESFNKVKITD